MIDRPSENEEEYIKRQELERLKQMREKAAKETAEQERTKLKELHWMCCPKCGLELAEVEFRGVIVDACFACGGMFFDHGEIDKIAEQERSGEAGVLGRVVSGLFGPRSR
jgi:hypothetical protein